MKIKSYLNMHPSFFLPNSSADAPLGVSPSGASAYERGRGKGGRN
jgi:hypothetical protein